ncbi:MAG: hypothetical protein J0H49_00435 [Acidobacteria bacterium]|nr:hypothetical protein [Acidobacteriota bacterium]
MVAAFVGIAAGLRQCRRECWSGFAFALRSLGALERLGLGRKSELSWDVRVRVAPEKAAVASEQAVASKQAVAT